MTWKDKLGHFVSGKVGRVETDRLREEMDRLLVNGGLIHDPSLDRQTARALAYAEQARQAANQQMGVSQNQLANAQQGAMNTNNQISSGLFVPEVWGNQLSQNLVQNGGFFGNRITGAWANEADDIQITLSPPVPFDAVYDDGKIRFNSGVGLSVGRRQGDHTIKQARELKELRDAVIERVSKLTGESGYYDENRGMFWFVSHFINSSKLKEATDEELVAGIKSLGDRAVEMHERAAERERVEKRNEARMLAYKVLQEHDSLVTRIGEENPAYLVFDQPLPVEHATDLQERGALLDHLRVLRSQQVQNAARVAVAELRDEIRQELLAEMGQTQKGKITL